MDFPSDFLDDKRASLALILAGLLLIAGGGVPYAISLADGAYDYEVTLNPAPESDADVDAESLDTAERSVLVNATVAPLYPEQPQHLGRETVTNTTFDVSVTNTLDQPPKGFSDGDIVHLDLSQPNAELLATSSDAEATDTFEVSVTPHREPLNLGWFGTFNMGLFVLAGGLKQRSDRE